MVKTYLLSVHGNFMLSPHFKVKEFRCKDGSDTVLIEDGLITTLEKVYDHFKCSKITIVSGYRTPSHDKAVGGKGGGNHCEGKAADFIAYDAAGKIIPSTKIVLYLEDAGVMGIGYRCGGSPNSTHVDVNYRSKKWLGDEKISMSMSIWDIKPGCTSYYDYLGIRKPASEVANTVEIVCAALNVRSGPGTGNKVIGSYVKGHTVKIIEYNADRTWGKTDEGWICIKPGYVREAK